TLFRSLRRRSGLERVLAAVQVSVVADVSGTRRGYAGLYGRIRVLSRLDALEEILHVRDGAVAEIPFREHRVLIFAGTLAIESEAATIDLQRRIRPAELDSTIIDRR